ncbi:hypothetical protein LEN26_009543 [Aphanomyces euteiches]|nr:hypothetical protein LEN26_009543 [Aphanomyces euteiches]
MKKVAGRYHRRYLIRDIREYVRLYNAKDPLETDKAFCKRHGIPMSTLARWKHDQLKYLSSHHRGSRRTLGRLIKNEVPFATKLLSYMDDMRSDEEYVNTSSMAKWLYDHEPEWRLLEWCRRFAYRNGYAYRVPCLSIMHNELLKQTKAQYARSFWSKFADYERGNIINVDETPLNYDMPPSRTLANKGQPSKCKNMKKNSDKITLVLGVWADGRKLPPLFILKGIPGGHIEEVLKHLPREGFYAVQKNAYMDERVWSFYLREVIRSEV